MGVRLRGQLTTLRRAVDVDVELLVAWHADPEVSRFWDDETFTAAQIRERLLRPDVDAYIVELAGSAIGYVESWRDADGPRRRRACRIRASTASALPRPS